MSGFNVFNYHISLVKTFTNRSLQTSNVGTNAKVTYNGVVKMYRDSYGFSLEDVRGLILYTFLHTDNPRIYGDIKNIFTTFGKDFSKWKVDYHYEIKNDGLFKTLWKYRPSREIDDLYDEIAGAFSL